MLLDRRIYEDTLANNTAAFVPRVRQVTSSSLHDPALAGMAPAAPSRPRWSGARHVGVDEPNDPVRETCRSAAVTGPADLRVLARRLWEG